MGLDPSQVCRFASGEDVKPFIERQQIRRAEAVPDALENLIELVREMKDIPKKDIRRRELAYRASMDTLKAVGIMPSPVQSLLITNIYQKTNFFQDPRVEGVLENFTKSLMGWASDEEIEV